MSAGNITVMTMSELGSWTTVPTFSVEAQKLFIPYEEFQGRANRERQKMRKFIEALAPYLIEQATKLGGFYADAANILDRCMQEGWSYHWAINYATEDKTGWPVYAQDLFAVAMFLNSEPRHALTRIYRAVAEAISHGLDQELVFSLWVLTE